MLGTLPHVTHIDTRRSSSSWHRSHHRRPFPGPFGPLHTMHGLRRLPPDSPLSEGTPSLEHINPTETRPSPTASTLTPSSTLLRSLARPTLARPTPVADAAVLLTARTGHHATPAVLTA